MALVFALAFDRGIVARACNALPQSWANGLCRLSGQTAWLLAIRFFEQRFTACRRIVLGTRFSSLIWCLEPLLLVIACVLWGGLLAEFVELPAAAKLRQQFGRRLDPQSIPTPS